MILALRRLAARSRLFKARQVYQAAYTEHLAACESRDTRRMHQARYALQAANRAVLTAERDALPPPAPLARNTIGRA